MLQQVCGMIEVYESDENVLGEVGAGFRQLVTHLPRERLAIAAQAMAAADAALLVAELKQTAFLLLSACLLIDDPVARQKAQAGVARANAVIAKWRICRRSAHATPRLNCFGISKVA